MEFIIEKSKFACGAFREAFKVATTNNGVLKIQVVKKYIGTLIELIKKKLLM